jgi:ribosomal protein S15P/S13E
MKPVKESTIEQAFTETVKKLFTEKDKLKDLLKTNIETNITSCKSEQLVVLENHINEISEHLLKIYKDYQNGKLSKENYFKQFEEKTAMSEKLLAEKNNLKEKNFKSIEDKMRIENILKFLEGKPDFDNFDADLFRDIVYKVVIHNSENINFEFKGGYNLLL